MNLAEYGTYLGISAILLGIVAGADLIFPPRLKAKCGALARRLLQVCGEPFGIKGYLFVLATSISLTVLVALLTGVWNRLIEEGELLSLPIKSAGPLIVAIIIKILVWDYFLALKSYVVMRSTRAEHAKVCSSGKKIGPLYLMLLVIGCCDILLSTALTSAFINTFEISSLDKLLSNSNVSKYVPETVTDFFDEFSFSLKSTIERAFYMLNGTFVFYFGAGLGKLAKMEDGIVDWSSVENKPFTILSIVLLAIVVVVLSSIALAYR